MIEVKVKCRHCRRSLRDKGKLIDSKPSIKVLIQHGKQKGALYLSSLYGSFTIEVPFKVPKGKTVRFFCPHCKKEIKGNRDCDKCGASMIPLSLKEGGLVQVCSRRGCKQHLFEFVDPEAEIRAFYIQYSTFFK